ncbi:MAG: urease accessory UreF family protein [Verrucomicrobiales bacterium]|nr:urease accessory UreF family protein [Verrucomicrobiales bacterium]
MSRDIESGRGELSWVTTLLHLSDSALPIGAYAHSFGLEGMIQMGMVHDLNTFDEFLHRDVAHSLKMIDFPLVSKSHAAMMDGLESELHRLDQLSWALRPSRQIREATSAIGRQQYRWFEKTWGSAGGLHLTRYQSPVVMGVIGAQVHIPVKAVLVSTAYQAYSALIQASLKLLPVGPRSTQKLLHSALMAIQPTIDEAIDLPEEELGSFNPVWDIAAARHERAPARMFLS